MLHCSVSVDGHLFDLDITSVLKNTPVHCIASVPYIPTLEETKYSNIEKKHDSTCSIAVKKYHPCDKRHCLMQISACEGLNLKPIIFLNYLNLFWISTQNLWQPNFFFPQNVLLSFFSCLCIPHRFFSTLCLKQWFAGTQSTYLPFSHIIYAHTAHYLSLWLLEV